jgi:hypothetical protein
VALKRPSLIGRSDLNGDGFLDSRFSTRFGRPRAGQCRIVTRFRGDADHSPSHSTRFIRC